QLWIFCDGGASVHHRFLKIPIPAHRGLEWNGLLIFQQRSRFVGQSDLQNFIHVFHEMHSELISDVSRNIREILLIVLRKYDRSDSGAMSRQELLLHPSNR